MNSKLVLFLLFNTLILFIGCQNEAASGSNIHVKKGIQNGSSKSAMTLDLLIYLEENKLELWKVDSDKLPEFISQHFFSTTHNLLPGLYKQSNDNLFIFNYLHHSTQLNKEVDSGSKKETNVGIPLDLEQISQTDLPELIKNPEMKIARLLVYPNRKVIVKPGYPHWMSEVSAMLELQQSKYFRDVK